MKAAATSSSGWTHWQPLVVVAVKLVAGVVQLKQVRVLLTQRHKAHCHV
jgi:hypothetical protein